MAGPLPGVTVVELAGIGPGPFAGLMLACMDERDRPPAPPLNLLGDYGGGGKMLALGVVAARFEAQRSGRGQVVDGAMTDGAATLMAPLHGMLAKGNRRDARQSNMLDDTLFKDQWDRGLWPELRRPPGALM
jgi:crotonobetainyl-CoA:carnitine CoA-transferase CaiB-like acyl-CoA transferase